ncbi:hypothetical protein M5K25_010704 [Dendrobium thyrsiflorum]|uniref:Uncharacterized protein n=1 Tax=Dendrobium thyrsiflorum TaxID=117978 RepID=A0ABD0V7W9_DENTH
MLRQEPNVVEGAKPNSDEGGVDRRSARKGEGYLHSWRSPVVASDQNVVTSDPMEGSRERSEVERRRREPHTERPSSFYRHRRSCDVRGVLTTCEVVRRHSKKDHLIGRKEKITVGEHTGFDHDRNLMVPFGGKTTRSEGPGHNHLPMMPFNDETFGVVPFGDETTNPTRAGYRVEPTRPASAFKSRLSTARHVTGARQPVGGTDGDSGSEGRTAAVAMRAGLRQLQRRRGCGSDSAGESETDGSTART